MTDVLTPKTVQSSALDIAELHTVRCLADAWNAFLELDGHHPDDLVEFRAGIHRLQEKVMARIARREYPEVFG